ncbi:alpha-tocopherol transfer protein-like, partial [Gryllus bimaculatus]
VHVHSDLNTFYQSVPKEILPKEYGGNAGTIKEISAKMPTNDIPACITEKKNCWSIPDPWYKFPCYSIMDQEWQKKLEAWRQYFAEDDQFCAVESKRPGRPKTHQDLFGLEGSFRPLAVD